MATATAAWNRRAFELLDLELGERWQAVSRLATGQVAPEDPDLTVDLYQVADTWVRLMRPLRDEYRRAHRRTRYITLSHLDGSLRTPVFDLDTVETAFGQLEYVEPLDRRISACILGVPAGSTLV